MTKIMKKAPKSTIPFALITASDIVSFICYFVNTI